MSSKDAARDWLDQRCGRAVHVETHMINATLEPLVNEGSVSKRSAHDAGLTGVLDESSAVPELYQVGTVYYNLADLPDNTEVLIRTEPVERLEITFDDGTSQLFTVMITDLRE